MLVLLCLAACGPKGGVPRGAMVEDSPLQTKPGRQKIRLEMAEVLLDKGRVAEATQLLKAAAEEGAKGPDIEVLQGRALLAGGLFDQARQTLEKASKEAPRDAAPYRWLALLEVEANNSEAALPLFAKAVEFGPNDAATWNNYGFVLFSTTHYAEADAALSKAVKLDTTNPRYRMNLAFNQAALRRDADALQSFRSAGTEADAQENLALACELRGDHDLARRHYELALQANPSQQKSVEALQRLNTAPGAEEHP
jgi:Flp pilus assembly protein TadD